MEATAGDSSGAPGWKRWSNAVFAGLFALTLILFSRILLPFAMPVLLGGFLVVLFGPVHGAIERRVARRAPAAALATVVVFALILLPMALIALLVAGEATEALAYAQALLKRVDLRRDLWAQVPVGLRKLIQLDPSGKAVQDALLSAVASGAGLVPGLVRAGTELAVDLFIMTVATYYFFLDGRRLLREGLRLVPIDPRYARQFCQEVQDVARAMAYGNVMAAVAQGVATLVGFWLAGVPHAAMWGLASILVSLVPVVGTALVWGPIGLGLLALGHYAEGLFVLAWGVLVVVMLIDHWFRPRLCGARMALHPLLVFLSMFGGIAVFGVMGLLVGPLVATLFMAMVRIYRRDYLGLQPLRAPEPAPSAPAPAPEPAPPAVPAPLPVPAPVASAT